MSRTGLFHELHADANAALLTTAAPFEEDVADLDVCSSFQPQLRQDILHLSMSMENGRRTGQHRLAGVARFNYK